MQIQTNNSRYSSFFAGAPFYIISLIVICICYLPQLLTIGMHSDGVAYATISRNLAEHRGSFWSPFFTETLFPQFYEHPPLAFGIQSIFFRLLGDHMYVEKIYTALCFIISGLLIIRLWAQITNSRITGWISVIYWVLISEVSFAYASNYLENTMGIFCFAACACSIAFIRSARRPLLLLFFYSFFIFLGFLTKGPFALFPLAVPVFYALSFKDLPLKRAIAVTVLSMLILAILFGVLFLIPAAQHNIISYFKQQVVASIAGSRATPGGRFFLFNTLIYKLKPVYLSAPALLIVFLIAGRGKIQPHYRAALFFFLMALSVNLPVIISSKQLEQYILCAYAFYALAGAALIYRYIEAFLLWLASKVFIIFQMLSVAALAALFFVLNTQAHHANEYGIDVDIAKDIEAMHSYIPDNSIVSTCEHIDGDWPLRCLLYRKYHISITDQQPVKNFYLTSGNCSPQPARGYNIVYTGKKYQLYAK